MVRIREVMMDYGQDRSQWMESLESFKLSLCARQVYQGCLEFLPECVTQDNIQNMLKDKSVEDLERVINELLGKV